MSRPIERSLSLSFVVATDTFETVRPVVERLREQTIAAAIELLLICPDESALDLPVGAESGLAAIRVLERPIQPVAEARADALRTAAGEIVFFGETHVYPEPRWAERLLAAFDGSTIAATTAIGSANPNSRLGWVALLLDYGRWVEGCEPPRDAVPYNNAAFKRTALLDQESELVELLQSESPKLAALLKRPHAVSHDSSVRINHLNVTRPPDWLRERYLMGRKVGGERAKAFTLGRRLLYAAASPAIALVIFSHGLRLVSDRPKRWGIVAALAVAAVAQSVGELFGYLGADLLKAQSRMLEYELYKVRYAGEER
jgi:hypothetical protein